MSKTIVSAFGNQYEATRLVDSAIASGFSSRFFSVIKPTENNGLLLNSMMCKLPGIQARLYRNHLRCGDCLLFAQVTEDEVPLLIKLLQLTGGHDIEAFDQVNAA